MTKKELIQSMTEKTGLSQVYLEKAYDALVESLTDSLHRNENIVLPGFGTFKVKDRPTRTTRNPQTGEMMEVPARRVPIFKAGSQLKRAVALKG